MTIQTKFDIGDEVFLIEHNKIMKMKIHNIFYDRKVIYQFLLHKSRTSLDKDVYITRDESTCFKTPEDLVNSYIEQKD